MGTCSSVSVLAQEQGGLSTGSFRQDVFFLCRMKLLTTYVGLSGAQLSSRGDCGIWGDLSGLGQF